MVKTINVSHEGSYCEFYDLLFSNRVMFAAFQVFPCELLHEIRQDPLSGELCVSFIEPHSKTSTTTWGAFVWHQQILKKKIGFPDSGMIFLLLLF